MYSEEKQRLEPIAHLPLSITERCMDPAITSVSIRNVSWFTSLSLDPTVANRSIGGIALSCEAVPQQSLVKWSLKSPAKRSPRPIAQARQQPSCPSILSLHGEKEKKKNKKRMPSDHVEFWKQWEAASAGRATLHGSPEEIRAMTDALLLKHDHYPGMPHYCKSAETFCGAHDPFY